MSSDMIGVLRIAGQVKNKASDNETLKRLKLNKKFTLTLVESTDVVRMGMVASVSHMVVYGKLDSELITQIKSKRKEKENVFFLHPPRGGFKKSSKLAAPKGILGKNKDLAKLVERML